MFRSLCKYTQVCINFVNVAASMEAVTTKNAGSRFDINANWRERKQIWRNINLCPRPQLSVICYFKRLTAALLRLMDV